MPEVTIEANLGGVDAVSAGFQRMGDSAASMGDKVANSSVKMQTNYRSLMMVTAGVISNSVQLGDIMDRIAKGQLDLGKGALLLTMNFIQLASQIYFLSKAHWAAVAAGAAHIATMAAQKAASIALTLAEGARAIAHAIANAVASMGIAVPIMIAAAAAASAAIGGYLIATHMAEGGLVTRPTIALLGERGPEVVMPLSRFSGITVTNYVVIENPMFRSRGDMDYLVDRLKRMGKA